MQTIPDRYPMPNLSDMTNSLFGCSFFSKLDLALAFHQIPVSEADQPKTAVTTPFGLFLFRRMPFGLSNASHTFQRFLDMVLQGLPFAQAYIDDILIASATPAQLYQQMRAGLQRLDSYRLRLRQEKCQFYKDRITFVGVEIS